MQSVAIFHQFVISDNGVESYCVKETWMVPGGLMGHLFHSVWSDIACDKGAIPGKESNQKRRTQKYTINRPVQLFYH